MKVFKFGGASIKDAEAVKNVVSIIKRYLSENPVVIISATGKSTNALELVVNEYLANSGKAYDALELVKQNHINMMSALFADENHPVFAEVNDMFVDVEWILEETPSGNYDQTYDQIVSLGELLSTKIVASYLNDQGIPAEWLDVRDCILTDNTYRDANIEWEETEKRILRIIPSLREKGIVITQGFLGITSENFTTTLGREGSDYSAAIFSYCLDAESMTIWKDVPGVLNGDPRLFKDVELLDTISYSEAIEMTYYGAQVIHPKTLQPLQSKNIPLYVKSFINPENNGTVVCADEPGHYPPVLVVKQAQDLLNISSKSFYFVDEARFSNLFNAFARHRIKVNMTQNTALAFSVVVNHDERKLSGLIAELSAEYDVEVIGDLKLITIRHSTQEVIDRMAKDRKLYLEERIKGTIQLVMNKDEVLV